MLKGDALEKKAPVVKEEVLPKVKVKLEKEKASLSTVDGDEESDALFRKELMLEEESTNATVDDKS